MSYKNFNAKNGINIDDFQYPYSVKEKFIRSNSITEIDSIALDSFSAIEYQLSIKQGSKIRTSSVILQTNGTSVDITEFGIVETGGSISGVLVSAAASGSDAVLKATVTDAESTAAFIKINRNINYPYIEL
jgi:hypothetical protein